MPLTSPQRQQLHAALLSAFDEDALRRMLAFELDTDLDAVVGKGPLAQRVFDLVAWAERQGKVAALIAGARRQNPGNSQLQAVAQAAKTWDLASSDVAPAQQPAIPDATSSQPPPAAQVPGSGAAAQHGGVAVGGDGHGNVTIYQNSPVATADNPSETDAAEQATEAPTPKRRSKRPHTWATTAIALVIVSIMLLLIANLTGWFGSRPDAPATTIRNAANRQCYDPT